MAYKCTKVCHQTWDAAEEHRTGLVDSGREHPARLKRLRSYFCRQHAAWHVGHMKSPSQRRQIERERAAR